MSIAQMLLDEMDHEVTATVRVLERVPQAHLSWRPHAKSMSLGQLALHVATIPGMVAELAVPSVRTEPSKFLQAEATSVAELVPALHASVARARHLLGAMDDDTMNETWRLLDGERELMAVPRVAFLRKVMLNHWYHHRGQLLVYLRMHGVPLPSVYGPSADENPFALAV